MAQEKKESDIAQDLQIELDMLERNIRATGTLSEDELGAALSQTKAVIAAMANYESQYRKAAESKRYSPEGLSERRLEFAQEADAALQTYEAKIIAPLDQAIQDTERALPNVPIPEGKMQAFIDERIDLFDHKALRKYMQEREIRDHLKNLDPMRIMALYDKFDDVAEAIDHAPAFMELLPPDVHKMAKEARLRERNPEVAARLDRLALVKNLHVSAVKSARLTLKLPDKREIKTL